MLKPLQFHRAINPRYGESVRLSPLIRRVVAHNPGPFTFTGTGTYIIGRKSVAIIDPGPADTNHIKALLKAVKGERITHILVTHRHRDHSPGARLLQSHTQAPIYAAVPVSSPKNSDKTIENGIVEEGIDQSFKPDEQITDKTDISGEKWHLKAIATPGHTSEHLCFELREENALFTGDHIMGWSTTVISPPEGHMGQYLASLKHVLAQDYAVLWPTHGPPIYSPRTFVSALIQHRHMREAAILKALEQGLSSIKDIVAMLYDDIPRALNPAAARSVFAHLIYLYEKGKVETHGPLGLNEHYRIKSRN